MKIDIMNINRFIEVNKLEEVTNPILLERGNYPTEDGLLSYKIFGRPGSYDRKTIFAYIDLKEKFIHPLIYKDLVRLNRNIEELISGISYFEINDSGEIIKTEDETKGKTGISFLYNNWNKINFKSTDSDKREERISLLKNLSKDEIFIDKWIVMPAFYRDINTAESSSGKISHETINIYYSKLIRLSIALRENAYSEIDFISNSTKGNLQKCLLDIFDHTIKLTKKKNGIFRQAVMGKSIDYASRNVISEANYTNTNSYKDMQVDMTHVGLPMATTISTFNPFIIQWIESFFKNITENIFENEEESKNLHPQYMDEFSYDEIKNRCMLFIKTPSERFEKVTLRLKDGKRANIQYKGTNKDSTIVNRYLTWTDVFYMACVDVVKDKHVYITRYPLEDMYGIRVFKVNVLSTIKTTPQYIKNTYYEYYPVIDPNLDKSKVQSFFIDSTQPFNSYLSGYGGDYDGDMVTIRGCFTQESNLEAEKILYSKSNIATFTGNTNKLISMEAVQTLYDLSL